MILINATKPPKKICLGEQGENNANSISLDWSDIKNIYSNVSLYIQYKYPSGTVYAITRTLTTSPATINIDSYMTMLSGDCEMQLSFSSGDTVIKTIIIEATVKPSITTSGATPPTPPIQKMRLIKTISGADEALNTTFNLDYKLAECYILFAFETTNPGTIRCKLGNATFFAQSWASGNFTFNYFKHITDDVYLSMKLNNPYSNKFMNNISIISSYCSITDNKVMEITTTNAITADDKIYIYGIDEV